MGQTVPAEGSEGKAERINTTKIADYSPGFCLNCEGANVADVIETQAA